MDIQEKQKREDHRRGGYLLRFESKAQRERIEKVANALGQTLRTFILRALESAARNESQQ